MYRHLNEYLLTLSFWLSQPCDDADWIRAERERVRKILREWPEA
jgi:hypothetical protein